MVNLSNETCSAARDRTSAGPVSFFLCMLSLAVLFLPCLIAATN